MPLTAPTLTVVDSLDGTHVVATVTGGHASATNTIRVHRDRESAWLDVGSRTGPGAVTLELERGYYWAYCDSAFGGESVASNVVRCPVTWANDSIHGRCADAIVAEIQSLELPGIVGVHRQMLPDETTLRFPCVVVHFNDAEQMIGGTNLRDDVGYPVHVLICDRKLTSVAEMPDKYLSWRQRIRRKFNAQRLAGVDEIFICNVQPQAVIDERLPAFDYLVSAQTVICVSRENRG